MALGADIARGRIIGHQVTAEVVVGELNFGITAQRVNLACLLAFLRINNDWVLFADGNSLLPHALRGSGRTRVWLGGSRRGGDHRMAIADAFFAGSSARGWAGGCGGRGGCVA